MIMRPLFRIPLLGFVLLYAGLCAAATPQNFTARYQVLRKGSPIGEATMSLRADGNGVWTYVSQIRGTSGLAGLLGARIDETSRFRWHDKRLETLDYDYRLDSLVNGRHRKLQVNWKRNEVVNLERGRHYSYRARPGLVDRHSLVLALGYALKSGLKRIDLPVAVKDRVQVQHYAVTGNERVSVPAGSFDAERVDRTDDNKNFSAWYVPDRYPVPVKLAQKSGDHMSLLLQSFIAH